MNQSDVYLAKLKTAGFSDEKIAMRLHMPVAEVKSRWQAILDEATANQGNGYNALCDAFTVLANQYQLVGTSLKIIAGALGSVITADELEKLITADPKQTYENLRTNCIILRKFTPVSPEELLKQTIAEN